MDGVIFSSGTTPYATENMGVTGRGKAVIPEATMVASQYEAMMGMAGSGNCRTQARFKWLGLGGDACKRLLR